MRIKFNELYQGIVSCLGETEYELEIKELLDDDIFGKKTVGDLKHRFNEYIVNMIWERQSLSPLYELLGRRNTIRLAQELGWNRNGVPQLENVQQHIHESLGIPSFKIRGREYYLEKVRSFSNGDTDSAVSQARRLFEQMFREILIVAMNSTHKDQILDTIINVRKLKLPMKWPKERTASQFTEEATRNLLRQTASGDGDYGFFVHLIHYSGQRPAKNYNQSLPSLSKLDNICFRQLLDFSKALGKVVHFNPKSEKTIQTDFQRILNDVENVVSDWVNSKIIPDSAIFLERTEGLFGSYYSGIDSKQRKIEVHAQDLPLGRRVIFWETNNPIKTINAWASPGW